MTTLRYGRHVTGGVDILKGLRQTLNEGGTAAQVFAGSPMSYQTDYFKQPTRWHDVRLLTEEIYTVVHASYFCLITQSPDDGNKRDMSRRTVLRTLEWAQFIGAHAVVIHPGSTLLPGWEKHARSFLEEIDAQYPGGPKLLLETMAGRTSLGRDLTDIAALAKEVNSDKFGVCVDLTHSWSAGLSISSLTLLGQQSTLWGIDLVHFNAPNPDIMRGGHRDRHTVSFADSAWDDETLERLWGAYKHLPCILEGTPNAKGDYAKLVEWSK